MGVQKTEVEVTSSVAAEKLYNALCIETESVFPKALPGAFKNVEILQGDGGVGTIKHITLGEGSPFKTMKHKIDAINKEALTFSYSIIDGDILLGIIESIENHFVFVPTADGGCAAKHTTIFNTKGDNVIPEENIKFATQQSDAVFKAVEAYLIAN